MFFELTLVTVAGLISLLSYRMFNNKKINFSFKGSIISINYSSSTERLSSLVAQLASRLTLRENQLKLIYKGLVIRDFNRTLDDLKITSNATIMVLVTQKLNIDTQQQFIADIESILNTQVLPLEPQLKEYEVTPTEQSKLVLQELLLQSILKLDSMTLPSEFTDARNIRKHSIKTTQSFLDRLDSATSKN